MENFDYDAAAELYPIKNGRTAKAVEYLRFVSAADAIRYAIEAISPRRLLGTHLVVDDERFDAKAIQQLYSDARYPLARRIVSKTKPTARVTATTAAH